MKNNMFRKNMKYGRVMLSIGSSIIIISILTGIGIKAINNTTFFSEYRNSPDWMNSDWQYRIYLTIDHDFIDEDLVDFPVWINITSDSLSDNAQSDGNDIRFYGNNSYNEMELLYGASGKAPIKERGGHDIFIKNNYAYVPCYWQDVLDVFDISNPYHPVLVANLTNTTAMLSGVSLDGIHDIVIQDDYAYVTNCVNHSIAVIDISNPLKPKACGYYWNGTTLGYAHGLDVHGNYLYSGTCYGSRVSIIDISNHTNPTQVAYINDSQYLDGARGFTYKNGYLYVTAATRGRLTCIDVSNQSNPFIVDSLELYYPTSQINNIVYNKISGDYCYVTSGKNATLYVVDISNPSNLTLFSKVKSTQYLNHSYYLTLDGNYAYVSSSGMDSVAKIDISNPSNPTIVDFLQHNNLLNYPSGMFTHNGYLYVSTRNEYGQPYSLIRMNRGYNLSHEIEHYDNKTGHLCAWVKIPKISSTVDTKFALYYGNPDCKNQQLKENVWHSNYTLVQHLSETSGTFEDSTIYKNDGTGMNDVTYGMLGKNYKCVLFDGLDDYISCDSDSSLKSDVLCLEMWIKEINITDGDDIFGYVGDSAKLRTDKNGNYLYWAVTPSSTEYKMYLEGGNRLDDQEWHHLVLQKNLTHLYVYMDGSEVFNLTGERQICPGKITYYSSSLMLGCHNYKVRYWQGLMDEFRVSSRNFNPSWMKAVYNTTANSNFLSFTRYDGDIEFIDDEIKGYLIDYEKDGTYNVFHNNVTGNEIDVEKLEDGSYLIDSDGDGKWDYTFDQEEGLNPYQKDEGEKGIPGFELILVFSALLLMLFWKQKRK